MSRAVDGGWETIPAHDRRPRPTGSASSSPSSTGTPGSPTPSCFDEARRFGAALVASGVEPGDRVAIWAPNSAEWIVALLGLFQAGAVLVPVNTRFKGGEAADILARSGARVLVTVTDFLGTDYVAMLEDAGVELPDLETHRRRPRARPAPTAESWERLPRPGDRRRRGPRSTGGAAAVGPDDPSDILFTSGHHRRAEGRRADPRPHAAGGDRLGGDDRASRRATATSWSTRTSTCSG